jgi:hypothetical protein
MPFGMAQRLARPVADWPQSAFASPSVFCRSLGGVLIGLMGICGRRFWMRLLPQSLGKWHGIDFEALPPGQFIARLMQLPVMATAKRHSELVADFETERPGLREPQVMRIRRLPPADEARLRGDKPQMGFVTQPLGLGNCEKALIDLPRHEAGCGRDNNRAAGGRATFQFTSPRRPIPGDQILAAAIVAGWPWDRSRIVRMEDMGVGGHWDGRRSDSRPADSSRDDSSL